MKVIESFVAEILQAEFGEDAAAVYEKSPLLQYLDRKMKAVHGDCKTRRSLANVYAIYSLLHFYEADFYGNKSEYRKFRGYEYTKLFVFCRSLYGGSKLQNHALNSRVNGEFRNKISSAASDLIIVPHVVPFVVERDAGWSAPIRACAEVERLRRRARTGPKDD